jgi:V/A-type H+-transporting ATPase subunit E
MSTTPQLVELESALLTRARTLAEEYLASARRNRDRIVADANERLRLREEREILAAKALADRTYRQRVQAAEIKQQEELDRLRWTLVRQILDRLPGELAKVVADQPRYTNLLAAYLARAATVIERDELVATLNAADRTRLAGTWDAFARAAVPDKRVALGNEMVNASGGVVVSSDDDTIRVNNTFEGRMERLQNDLQRVVTERLFASTEHMGALFSG